MEVTAGLVRSGAPGGLEQAGLSMAECGVEELSQLLRVGGALGERELGLLAAGGDRRWPAPQAAGPARCPACRCTRRVQSWLPDDAVDADSLQADQDLFLRAGFQAGGSGDQGAVRLPGAHIGGSLNMSSVSVRRAAPA